MNGCKHIHEKNADITHCIGDPRKRVQKMLLRIINHLVCKRKREGGRAYEVNNQCATQPTCRQSAVEKVSDTMEESRIKTKQTIFVYCKCLEALLRDNGS
jgi:hypothetical protein